jgi:hypothetical protein
MEPIQSSETSAFNTQTPGKYPEDNLSLLQHGESLKTRKKNVYTAFPQNTNQSPLGAWTKSVDRDETRRAAK